MKTFSTLNKGDLIWFLTMNTSPVKNKRACPYKLHLYGFDGYKMEDSFYWLRCIGDYSFTLPQDCKHNHIHIYAKNPLVAALSTSLIQFIKELNDRQRTELSKGIVVKVCTDINRNRNIIFPKQYIKEFLKLKTYQHLADFIQKYCQSQ